MTSWLQYGTIRTRKKEEEGKERKGDVVTVRSQEGKGGGMTATPLSEKKIKGKGKEGNDGVVTAGKRWKERAGCCNASG